MLRRSFVGLLLLAGIVQAADFRPAELDGMIDATRKLWGVPGVAVAIVHGDDTVYLKGFGVKRVGSSEPVTPDTLFAICSCTKAFTSAALGILVNERKLSWDEPVRKHLPYFKLSDPLADADVTMRDLLCHRTGLGGSNDLFWVNTSLSREEIIRTVALLPLRHPFRASYDYQNIPYLAAGEAVGRVAGTSWEEFVSRRVLGPLGMTNTDFTVKDALQSADHATPHKRRGGEIEPIDWPHFEQVAPAGAINSSVRDLARWMRLHLNEGKFDGKVILTEAAIHETHMPQMVMRVDEKAASEGAHFAAYGMGWFIQDYRGHHMLSNPGATDGWHSMITLLPDERYGIAILSNLGAEQPLNTNITRVLRDAITDQLLGLPAKDRTAAALAEQRQAQENVGKRREQRESGRRKDTKPSLAVADYVGAYEHPVYGRVQVRENAGKLEFEWHNWRCPLDHYNFDTFRLVELGPLQDQLAQFRMNLDGNIRSIYFLGQEFNRRP
jgi:CubicO group peptidase (beta-lactamase class C family)